MSVKSFFYLTWIDGNTFFFFFFFVPGLVYIRSFSVVRGGKKNIYNTYCYSKTWKSWNTRETSSKRTYARTYIYSYRLNTKDHFYDFVSRQWLYAFHKRHIVLIFLRSSSCTIRYRRNTMWWTSRVSRRITIVIDRVPTFLTVVFLILNDFGVFFFAV